MTLLPGALTVADPLQGDVTWLAASVEPVERNGQDRPADELIGPGILGFLVTFAVAVALVFLARDMNRRIQRLRYRRDVGTDPDTPGPTPEPGARPTGSGNPG